jgi:hypothetical protein
MFYSLGLAISNVCLGYLVEWNLRATLIMLGGLIGVLAIVSRIEEDLLLD